MVVVSEFPGIEQDACQFRNWPIYRTVTSLAVFRLRYCGAATGGSRTKTVSKSGSSPNRSNLVLAFSAGLRYQSAMSNDSIESLAKKLAESLPEGLRSVRDDLETNFRGVLQTGISKLDLVTREEFEVQQAVLLRTREKLEVLEAKLKEIEDTE